MASDPDPFMHSHLNYLILCGYQVLTLALKGVHNGTVYALSSRPSTCFLIANLPKHNCRMMESGLLPKDVAKKVYEKKLKKNQQQKVASPVKAAAVKKTTNSVTVKKKTLSSPVSSKQSTKRKIEDGSSEEDSDDDLVLSKKITKRQRVA